MSSAKVERKGEPSRQVRRKLWDAALEATYSEDVATAAARIEQALAAQPDDAPCQLLHGRNLAQRRLFDEAERVLRGIEAALPRSVWLPE